MELSSYISSMYGLGPKRAEVLASEAGISTIEDLLYYFPYKYIDRSRFYSVREVTSDSSYIQLHGKIKNIRKEGNGKNARLGCIFYDETGEMELIWFKGLQYVATQLNPTKEYIVFGKPNFFNGRFSIAHPELEEYTPNNVRQCVGWQAVYNTTIKMKKSYMTSANIRKIIYNALASLNNPIKETLPQYITEPLGLMPLNRAIRNIHFPENLDSLQKAQARLKFEELFYIQLSLLKISLEIHIVIELIKVRNCVFAFFKFKTLLMLFKKFSEFLCLFRLIGLILIQRFFVDIQAFCIIVKSLDTLNSFVNFSVAAKPENRKWNNTLTILQASDNIKYTVDRMIVI